MAPQRAQVAIVVDVVDEVVVDVVATVASTAARCAARRASRAAASAARCASRCDTTTNNHETTFRYSTSFRNLLARFVQVWPPKMNGSFLYSIDVDLVVVSFCCCVVIRITVQIALFVTL